MSDHQPLKDRLSRQVDALCRVAAEQGVPLETLVASFPAVQQLTDDVTTAMHLVFNGMDIQETSLEEVLSALPAHYEKASADFANRCDMANEVNRMNMEMCLSARKAPSH